MAILGFMAPNYYAVISSIGYSKQAGQAHIDLAIYADSEKTTLVTNLSIPVTGGDKTARPIKGIGLNTPPFNPPAGSRYQVGASPRGAWVGENWTFAGAIVKYDGASWVGDGPRNEVFYHESEKKYYAFDVSEKTMTEVKHFDSRVFDSLFGIAAQSEAGGNIMKSGYDYLMTRPEFAGCTEV
jgi:hypothetical protein